MAKKERPKKNKIILTIRATTAPDIKALDELKKKTNAKTYAGAIMTAAIELPVQIRRVEELRKQIADLERIKRQQQDVLHMHYSASKMLDLYGAKHLKGKGKFPEPEMFDDSN